MEPMGDDFGVILGWFWDGFGMVWGDYKDLARTQQIKKNQLKIQYSALKKVHYSSP